LEVFGCSGGKMEKETEASGYFEVDDAKCKDGHYDIKLDKDFKVIAITPTEHAQDLFRSGPSSDV
jgi:hypothetical protein